MAEIDLDRQFPRKYLPAEADLSRPDEVRQQYENCAGLSLGSASEVEVFLDRLGEVEGAISEVGEQAAVAASRDTRDEAAAAAHRSFSQAILPVATEAAAEARKRMLAAPGSAALGGYYGPFLREARAEVELFCEANLPLVAEHEELKRRYDEISGGWMVDLDGERVTRPAAAARFEEPDRDLREKAWRAFVAPHRADAAPMEELFDAMLTLRRSLAANADKPSFREYMFQEYARFDYAPDDCFDLHAAIEAHVVPVVSRMAEERRRRLGVPALRPWDLKVDPDGAAAVRAFDGEDEFKRKVSGLFHALDPELASLFDGLAARDLLDLGSREGKAPGGFMTDLSEQRLAFIFLNAVGTTRDIGVLLHESGHAFHYLLAREQRLPAYRQAPLEFAEVASMGMELLARRHYAEVFDDAGVRERVLRKQLEEVLEFLPFMAMVDAFQHWLYTTSEATDVEARAEHWIALDARFRPHIDWSGLEDLRRLGWQYPHVYRNPFYYIEYGIAQLGALQVWRNQLQDPELGLRRYKQALALGGSRGLAELFEAAGARFAMDGEIVEPLVRLVEENLT